MRLLVTGGAGFIGSVVAARLLREGHEVTVFDNLLKGHEEAVAREEGAEFVRGDLLDVREISGALAPGFDGVVHLAALSLVGESVKQPGRYYGTNVLGTLNLLGAMVGARVSRIVFSSTAAVYGEPEETPIREDAPTRPGSPYGGSKLAVDGLLGFYAAAHGLSATSLRYFNVAGASADGRFGEDHEPETHLIPLVLRAAAGRREAVEVYGTDYPTRDGTAVRDYVHVEDLALAHELALGGAAPGEHRVYNLGNGAGFTVQEVIGVAREVTGREIEAVEAPRRRPGRPRRVERKDPEGARLDPGETRARNHRLRRLGLVPRAPERLRRMSTPGRSLGRPALGSTALRSRSGGRVLGAALRMPGRRVERSGVATEHR